MSNEVYQSDSATNAVDALETHLLKAPVSHKNAWVLIVFLSVIMVAVVILFRYYTTSPVVVDFDVEVGGTEEVSVPTREEVEAAMNTPLPADQVVSYSWEDTIAVMAEPLPENQINPSDESEVINAMR